jgi:hypothetical protein
MSNPNCRKFILNKMPKNAICCEIGVWKGNFSDKILKNTKPKKLYLIDPWKYEPQYDDRLYGIQIGSQANIDQIFNFVVKKFKDNKKVVIIRKRSEEALPEFKNDYFDWIYIDGNHSYQFVKKDLQLSLQKVKIGGFITGDDYIGEVKIAVNEFSQNAKVILIETKEWQYMFKRIK